MITDAAFVGGLVAVALVASGTAWVVHRRRPRMRRALRASTVVVAVLLSVAAVADVVNAHYGYLPRSADVVGIATWPTARASEIAAVPSPAAHAHRRGAVVAVPLTGRVSGFGTRDALVYLPPQYFDEPSRRFPVAYLLHGSPGQPKDWFRSDRAADVGLTAARAGYPLILVAPRVNRSWLGDSECVDGAHDRVETYVLDDVVPGTDAALRTLPVRQDRAVVGNSAGGYCALNLGLRHRQTFGTIVDMSGYTRPTFNGGMPGLFGPRPDLSQVVEANTPALYAPQLCAEPGMRIWFDVGRSDQLPRTEITAVAPLLRDRGQQVAVHLRPGGHVHQVWRAALRESLGWFAAGAPGGQPG
jgi:enterochelin esterase-like enzyme